MLPHLHGCLQVCDHKAYILHPRTCNVQLWILSWCADLCWACNQPDNIYKIWLQHTLVLLAGKKQYLGCIWRLHWMEWSRRTRWKQFNTDSGGSFECQLRGRRVSEQGVLSPMEQSLWTQNSSFCVQNDDVSVWSLSTRETDRIPKYHIDVSGDEHNKHFEAQRWGGRKKDKRSLDGPCELALDLSNHLSNERNPNQVEDQGKKVAFVFGQSLAVSQCRRKSSVWLQGLQFRWHVWRLHQGGVSKTIHRDSQLHTAMDSIQSNVQQKIDT